MDLDYDKADAKSIESYAKKLVGKTFRDVVKSDSSGFSSLGDGGKKNKGGLGNLIEERYFHYKVNSDSGPDFREAGVELKVTPYKISNNKRVSKERLVITMIDYMKVVNESFNESHMWLKAHMMLLVFYLYQKEILEKLDYRIDYVSLFTPPEKDLVIIRNDYNIIISKIKAGKAHELSEGDTMYLAASTKASNSAVHREQPFSEVPAKQRAFSFKNSYMTYVLNNYIAADNDDAEAIVSDGTNMSFDEYVYGRISRYVGKTVSELCDTFGVDSGTNAKNLYAILVCRMLGVKRSSAEEFVKAGIKVKAIRVANNNSIRESMSFPKMSFKEVASNEWDASDFKDILETKFFFVVFKQDEIGELKLIGCKFWNMPYPDILEARKVWQRTHDLINNGLEISFIDGKYRHNLPKIAENPVCHVRPHAQNAKDVDVLPDGRVLPKQSFWLNNTYIEKQICDLLE